MRLTRWWIKRDEKGHILFDHNPNLAADRVCYRLICIVDECGEIKGYHSPTQLDKFLMLAYWRKYDGLTDDILYSWESFNDWFLNKATGPEYIRRQREKMLNMKIADVPAEIKEKMRKGQEGVREMFGQAEEKAGMYP